MEAHYYCIALLGLSAFYAQTCYDHLQGTNHTLKAILTIVAGFGFLSFIAIIITGFFFMRWWHPALIFAAVCLAAWLTRNIGRNLYVGILSAIGVFVFSFLAWYSLLT